MPYLKTERNKISVDEEWREIPGLNGYYSISSLGRVYSNRYSRFINTYINHYGYGEVSIRNKHYMVHRLIASAFLGFDLDSVLEINHIDGNKKNNSLENLEIVSHRQNMQHAWRTGLISFVNFSRESKRAGEIAQRLRFYVDSVARISHIEFQERTGVSRNILKDNSKSIREQTIEKITKEFPLNPEWIKNGTGEMLIKIRDI